MERWTALAAVAAFGLGVGRVVKADPRGAKPIGWSEAAKDDQVRLAVGQVKEWGYHSHGDETHKDTMKHEMNHAGHDTKVAPRAV